MVSYREGLSCGYTCPKCGNGWATTYLSPIESDTTSYDIVVDAVETPSVEQIRIVAKMSNCNFIAAKSLLNNGGRVRSAKAKEILESIAGLRKAELTFSVQPDFPYDF